MRIFVFMLALNALPLTGLPLIKISFNGEAKVSVEVKPPLAVLIRNRGETILDEAQKALKDELASVNLLSGPEPMPEPARLSASENDRNRPEFPAGDRQKERIVLLSRPAIRE